MGTELPDIDFSIPPFLIHHYHVSGTIAILMNTFVVYLILFKNRKMDSFRYYLLSFQLACSFVDLHLSFTMQPIPLFPLVSGYCAGLFATQFNWSPHFLMTLLSLFLGFQVNTLALCFLRKHQAITQIEKRYKLSKPVNNLLMLIFLLYTFVYTIPYYFSRLSKEEQFRIIDQKYSRFRSQFEQLPDFDLYELNPQMAICFLTIIAGCLHTTATVSLFAFQMYMTLQSSQHHLSKSTLDKHKTALKSLVAQFLTTPTGILPAMLIISTLFVQFNGAQKFTWYMLLIMTTHSTINSFVVIFTNPEFRAIVLFWSKEGRLRKSRSSVSTVHDVLQLGNNRVL